MKTRKVFHITWSILLTFCCLHTVMNTTVHANDTVEYYQEISELAGIQFFSYDNLTEFSLRKKDIIKYEDIVRANITCMDYVLIMDSLYVPSKLIDRIHEFESCLITPTYVCTSFMINDIRHEFYYYYSEISGITELNEAIRYFEEGLHSSGKDSHNDNSIYFYERPYLNNTVESYYVWQQENKYFVLRVNTAIDEKNLELCDAESVPLPTADESFSGGSYVDKAADTYDFAVFAAVAAIVSACGWRYSVKKH